MLPYATHQDIIDTYGPEAVLIAADRDGDDQPDQAAIDEALAAGTVQVRAIELRRQTPVADQETEDGLRRTWTIDIALYLLAMGTAAKDEYSNRRDQALQQAKDYYQPAVNGTPATGNPDANSNTGAASSANSRLFDRRSMGRL